MRTAKSIRLEWKFRIMAQYSIRFNSKWKQEAQLPQRNSASTAHVEGARPSSPLLLCPSGYTYAYGRIRKPQRSHNVRTSSVPSTKRTLRWIAHSRSSLLVICCRNVQLMPTLFLKLRKIRQREHSKFVHFNDLTQVWRRPSKKRLRISTNDLYCQKLELLTYISVADSMGLHSLVFR